MLQHFKRNYDIRPKMQDLGDVNFPAGGTRVYAYQFINKNKSIEAYVNTTNDVIEALFYIDDDHRYRTLPKATRPDPAAIVSITGSQIHLASGQTICTIDLINRR